MMLHDVHLQAFDVHLQVFDQESDERRLADIDLGRENTGIHVYICTGDTIECYYRTVTNVCTHQISEDRKLQK